MGHINAHIFETKEQADAAMQQLNDHHKLPVPGGSSMFDSTSYSFNGEVYYIEYSLEWTSILGQPTKINA